MSGKATFVGVDRHAVVLSDGRQLPLPDEVGYEQRATDRGAAFWKFKVQGGHRGRLARTTALNVGCGENEARQAVEYLHRCVKQEQQAGQKWAEEQAKRVTPPQPQEQQPEGPTA